MKLFFIATALFLWVFPAAAQTGAPYPNAVRNEGRAPYRTEFISYDIRREADEGRLAGSKYYRALAFKPAGDSVFEATLDVDGLWLDREVYVRDTGRTGRYLLTVNGHRVGYNTSSYGVSDYSVTPYLREGENRLSLVFAPDIPGGGMERFEAPAARAAIENLYIWSQPRIHIFDYTISGHHDEEFRDAVIDLAVVVVNGFNMPETVRVGYDVFDPDGNLKEYAFVEAEIPGRGCDTVRFYNKVTGTGKFLYSAANPALYRVVLSLRHGGRNTEYIPVRLGFGLTDFDGGALSRGGVPIAVKAAEGDFPVRAGTLEKLRGLKRQGYNTVAVVRPQQKWFYEMAASEGVYVIDRAAVECDPRGGDRGPDGTLANDPSLVARFLDRQQAMYYRGRNYPNIIGWSIGGESGNGYNMYKSYQLLKSLDGTRPVIYPFAEGEWNTDSNTN